MSVLHGQVTWSIPRSCWEREIVEIPTLRRGWRCATAWADGETLWCLVWESAYRDGMEEAIALIPDIDDDIDADATPLVRRVSGNASGARWRWNRPAHVCPHPLAA